MSAAGLRNVDFISVNTDAQALKANTAPMRMQIGQMLTRGRGTGGNPEIGRKAALEAEEALGEVLADAEMVFVTAGMGGGTGTGSAPVIARIARESGALTVGVVTKPLQLEGRKRMGQDEEGLRELKNAVDTLITIPNQRLLSIASRTTSLKEAFQKADDVLLQAVRGIAELVTVHGLINLDFAGVRSIMAAARGGGDATVARIRRRARVLPARVGARPALRREPPERQAVFAMWAAPPPPPQNQIYNRPVRRLGMIVDDNTLDIPAFKRRAEER